MIRLIVNADDFGISGGVNRAVARGFDEGILTSASLMAAGKAADEAASMARERPELGVGVHLCITGAAPLLDPSDIPTITSGGMLFSSPLEFMTRLATGRVSTPELHAELKAQVERALSLGITPTHLDGHQHMHVMPGVALVVAALASEFDIPAVRYPVGPWYGKMGYASAAEKFILERLAKSQRKHFAAAGLKSPERFYGLAQTGRLGVHSLKGIIRAIQNGTSELMCHPGIKDDPELRPHDARLYREKELAAVTDAGVKELVMQRDIELISFGSL